MTSRAMDAVDLSVIPTSDPSQPNRVVVVCGSSSDGDGDGDGGGGGSTAGFDRTLHILEAPTFSAVYTMAVHKDILVASSTHSDT